MMIRIYSSLLKPVRAFNFSNWHRSRCRGRSNHVGVGLSRCFVKVPPLPLQDSGWKGCSFSLRGLFSHLAVLFNERPEMKNVRAKAPRSLAAKTQAVVGSGGVGEVV